jgi:hypothetical protein
VGWLFFWGGGAARGSSQCTHTGGKASPQGGGVLPQALKSIVNTLRYMCKSKVVSVCLGGGGVATSCQKHQHFQYRGPLCVCILGVGGWGALAAVRHTVVVAIQLIQGGLMD